MYYILDQCPSDIWEDTAVFDDVPEIEGVDSWISGEPFEVSISEPITIPINDTPPASMPHFFNDTIPLMSSAMVKVLTDYGVDNLNTYSTVLVGRGGNVLSKDYLAVNVIGKIAAADRGKSEVGIGNEDGMIDTLFDSLSLDPSKTGGHLLFRLAESVSVILIHESIKEKLESNGIDDLGYIKPEDYVS